MCVLLLFFFFKQKTAYEMRISDWSSDVCSSDLLDQLVGLGDPERPAAALEPVVEDDAGDLAALARPGAVAQEPTAPEAQGVHGFRHDRIHRVEGLVHRVMPGEEARMGLAGVDQAFELGVGEDAGGHQPLEEGGPGSRQMGSTAGREKGGKKR